MKHLLLALLFPLFLSCVEPDQSLRVKLIDYTEDKIPAYCGYFAFATTLKFELREDYDTLKTGQHILVVITCPRELGMEKYVNNREYDLKVYGNSPEDQKHINYGWAMWHQYQDEKLPKFWCRQLIPR